VTVQPGQEAEFTLTCADDAKGIVAGYDMDEGLVNLGNDPRPIIRVFKFYNPTNGPLSVDLYLHCLKNRTRGGNDGGGHIVNTATVTTSTPESSTADNKDSAAFNIDTSPPVVLPKTVQVSSTKVSTAVSCGKGGGVCKGQAVLVAEGTVLAKGSYKIKSGKKLTVHLKKTAAGKKMLGKLKKAQLRIDGKVRTVTLKH
jgi:hypothetical protein